MVAVLGCLAVGFLLWVGVLGVGSMEDGRIFFCCLLFLLEDFGV